MTALADAERFLWLHNGPTTDDDPVDLLSGLVYSVKTLGAGLMQQAKITKLEMRVLELEAQLRQANERTRRVEHLNVQLTEQLAGDRLFRRVQEMEREVKRYRELVRKVEHEAVKHGIELRLKSS